MSFVKMTLCGLLLVAGLAGSASADIIADYVGDHTAGKAGDTRAQARADGWNYLWNSGGEIGTATNYTSLDGIPTLATASASKLSRR